MVKSLWIAFSTMFILASCFRSGQDGTEGVSKHRFQVKGPGGKPAAGTQVKVFKLHGTQVEMETEADASGHFDLPVQAGAYSLYLKKEGLASFQDSLELDRENPDLQEIVLDTTISLSGTIALQPGDDARTVVVHVLGTDIHENIGVDGRFRIDQVPQGKHRLRFSTTLSDYVETYRAVTIEARGPALLKDTLDLIFTGIPAVRGLNAAYDTLAGAFRISWSSVDFPNLQEYLLYRSSGTSGFSAESLIATLTDTAWLDFAYPGGAGRFLDTAAYAFRYRVKVKDRFEDQGRSYGYLGVTAYPPRLVWTRIAHQMKSKVQDTVSPGDTISILATASNPTRRIKEMSWSVGTKVLRTVSGDGKRLEDTLFLALDAVGRHIIRIRAEDEAGTFWTDSLSLTVIEDAPLALAGNDSLVLTNSHIILRADAWDRFGSIRKWEWDIGNTDDFRTTGRDTIIRAPDRPTENFLCILRVTDDDGAMGLDTIRYRVRRILIHTPANSESVGGVFTVSGTADPEYTDIQVKLDPLTWVRATGTVSWQAQVDTRMIFPPIGEFQKRLMNLHVRGMGPGIEEEKNMTQVWVAAQPNPLLGAWTCTIQSIVRSCDLSGNCVDHTIENPYIVTFRSHSTYGTNGTWDSPDNGAFYCCLSKTWSMSEDGSEIIIHRPTSSDFRYTPVFTDYDHVRIGSDKTASGVTDCVRK